MLRNIAPFVFIINLVLCGPHNHKSKVSTKETIEDGFFTNRDAMHYKDGKHNHEFDHEAVLGLLLL